VAVRRGGVAQPQRHNRHRPTPPVLEGVEPQGSEIAAFERQQPQLLTGLSLKRK
jgi:hypothetical protein